MKWFYKKMKKKNYGSKKKLWKNQSTTIVHTNASKMNLSKSSRFRADRQTD